MKKMSPAVFIPGCFLLIACLIFAFKIYTMRNRLVSAKSEKTSTKTISPQSPELEYHLPSGWSYATADCLPVTNQPIQKMILGRIEGVVAEVTMHDGVRNFLFLHRMGNDFLTPYSVTFTNWSIRVDVGEGGTMWAEIWVNIDQKIFPSRQFRVAHVTLHVRSGQDINYVKY